MTIVLQIISDTHIEFLEGKKIKRIINTPPPEKGKIRILALLGDICCCGSDQDFENYKSYVMLHIDLFEYIILVPGNHEFWYDGNSPPGFNNCLQGIQKKLATFASTNKKIILLDNKSFVIDKKIFVGTTLWTWINDVEQAKNYMNDYKFIYINKGDKIVKLDPMDVNVMYHRNVGYLKSIIKKGNESGYKVIVLTHHKPYISTNPINYFYESDLMRLINKPVILWGYGHTHKKDESVINGVKMYCNCKGYPAQKTLFKNSDFIIIE